MILTDTHAHLYLPDFAEDIEAIMLRARDAGVENIFMPCIDSTVIPSMLELESRYPENCFLMMGLHPCSVKEDYKTELAGVEGWLQQRRFAAIGEIGLDMYWDKTHIDQQYEAFESQVRSALQYKLPIVIHSRDALDECIGVVKKNQDGSLGGIFHCFGGTAKQADDIINLGFYLGIGGVLTYKNSGLAETIKHVPLGSIVLETDAPYLTPVPFRGKRNESSYLSFIVEKLATIKGISKEEVATVTTANAQKIFRK